MELDDAGADGFVFKVKQDGFDDVGAEVLPGLGAGEDGVAEGAGEEAAFVGFADFEYYFHFHKNTLAMLKHAQGKVAAMYRSLGATDVFFATEFGATHNMGTARMGKDAATSVCNKWGQTHDIRNLFVSDGSLFVTSASANPTLTIISLALRQAEYLERQLKSGAV